MELSIEDQRRADAVDHAEGKLGLVTMVSIPLAELKAIEAERDALKAAAAWQPIESGLPEAGRNVLAFFRYASTGKGRRVRAMYAPHLSLSEDDWGDFQGDTDYSDETDLTYWPEGWYETNECEETHWKLTEEVTHWLPLPAEPNTQAPASP